MRYCLILLLTGLFTQSPFAQKAIRKLTLSEAISIAWEQSIEALEAQSVMRIAYWEYRNFRAELLPNLVLGGTLPNLNKSLSSYQNEDGSYRFVPNSSISEKLSFALTQNIPQTGGSLSVESQIERLDQIGDKKTTTYLSIPATLVLNQPLISFNSLKWERRIQPVKYLEAQKQFSVNMEYVSILTVNYYFDLLLSTINKDIAEQNLKNSTALYDIALGKKRLGLISENDQQQLKLGKLRASASVVTMEQECEKRMHSLRNFLGIRDDIELQPEIPAESPVLEDINHPEVMEIVSRNHPFSENTKRRLIETQRSIAQAQSERGFKLDVYASIGFTGSNPTLPDSYQNLQNRQMVNLGIRLPILDWGKGRGKVEVARNRQKVEEGRIEKEINDFNQNIRMLITQIQNQPYLTDIYRQADSLAQNRYKIAYETFVMGKINVIDINTAQTEEDEARRNYINQLYLSWLYYYNLRQVTLYDFENKTDIINDLNESRWTEKFLLK